MDWTDVVKLCDECRFPFYPQDLEECSQCDAPVCEDCRPGHAAVEDGYDEDVDGNDQPDGFY